MALPLIIDTDLGADDVTALLLALSVRDELDVDVQRLTSVVDNVQLNYTSRNARMVREWADRHRCAGLCR